MEQQRPPFDVIPFSGGIWKVLDWSHGRYVRAYDTLSAARRYASARNRKAGFHANAATIRNAPEPSSPVLMSDREFDALLRRHQRALEGSPS